MCAGGPLHGRRLSVPTGLQWFEFDDANLPFREPSGDKSKVIPIEQLTQAVSASNSDPCKIPPANRTTAIVYSRRSFITGEKGMIEVFGLR